MDFSARGHEISGRVRTMAYNRVGRLYIIESVDFIIESVDSISRDERDAL